MKRPGGKAKSGRRRRAEAAFAEASSLHASGRLGEAFERYQAVLALDASHFQALLNLGLLCLQGGQPNDAIALLERAVKVETRDPIALGSLGNAYRASGRMDDAIRSYRRTLRAAPAQLNAAVNLASTLQRTGDATAAVRTFATLLERHAGALSGTDAAEIWSAYGGALLDAGDPTAARRAQRTALDAQPGYAPAHNELGLIAADLGEFAEAEAHYADALRADPSFTKAYLNLSLVRRFSVDDASAIQRIRNALDEPGRPSEQTAELHFALGKMLDDIGEYREAFRHYRAGNANYPTPGLYDPAEELAQAARICEWFRPGRSAGNEELVGSEDARPTFIVGMPRSGTSLVEQILASHPDIFGAGELTEIDQLTRRLVGRQGYPEGLSTVNQRDWASMASGYLARLSEASNTAARVTDKMPGNFRYVGLIAQLFPRATFIFCEREPLDVCVSIFFRHFVNGHFYAYDLEHIAVEYAVHERLMRHWLSVYGERIYPLRYERLVRDQEAQSRALIEHLAMPWDDACLSFHETKRSVHTASNWQVRRPIYSQSVARFERYGDELDALKSRLRELNVSGRLALGS
ncbi:MAG: sulfotransferase [Pseudomonadota bacterium]